jgi:small subunit ribosomal protein S7
MKHGRKAEAEGRVSRILSLLYAFSPLELRERLIKRQGATNQNPRPLLQRAVTLSSPSIRVVSSRARAKTTQTPLALTERQRTRQGIVWILKAAEKGRKGGVPRETRIAKEVLAVLEGNSDVFKWLEEKHKVATANRYV